MRAKSELYGLAVHWHVALTSASAAQRVCTSCAPTRDFKSREGFEEGSDNQTTSYLLDGRCVSTVAIFLNLDELTSATFRCRFAPAPRAKRSDSSKM